MSLYIELIFIVNKLGQVKVCLVSSEQTFDVPLDQQNFGKLETIHLQEAINNEFGAGDVAVVLHLERWSEQFGLWQ